MLRFNDSEEQIIRDSWLGDIPSEIVKDTFIIQATREGYQVSHETEMQLALSIRTRYIELDAIMLAQEMRAMIEGGEGE